MHLKCEVNRCRPYGQLNDIALRCEDEDFVLVEIDVQILKELIGIRHVLLPLQNLSEPCQLLIKLGPSPTLFVLPVSCDTH